MALTLEQLAEIVAAADFERLIGEVENDWFDCKNQPYGTQDDQGKRDLAKDVSSFANAAGGYIFIGVRTNPSAAHLGDAVETVRPFEQTLIDPDQYHKIIEDWVYPVPEGVSIQWRATIADPRKGVVVIHIPPQIDSIRPFLITRTIDAGKQVEIVFGLSERKRDTSQPTAVADLQRALRSGFHFETAARKSAH